MVRRQPPTAAGSSSSSAAATLADPTPTADPAALAALEAAFRDRLDALQQPADCGAAPLYLFVPHAFASGIGSQLRIVANSMMQARTRCAHCTHCAHHTRCAHRTRCACCEPLLCRRTVHPCASVLAQAVVAGRTFVLDDAIAHSTFVDPRRCVPPGDSRLQRPSPQRHSLTPTLSLAPH